MTTTQPHPALSEESKTTATMLLPDHPDHDVSPKKKKARCNLQLDSSVGSSPMDKVPMEIVGTKILAYVGGGSRLLKLSCLSTQFRGAVQTALAPFERLPMDIVANKILPFLGSGHHLLLAPVSKLLRAAVIAFETKHPPLVAGRVYNKPHPGFYKWQFPPMGTKMTQPCHCFLTVSCAMYVLAMFPVGPARLKVLDWLAEHSTKAVLKWSLEEARLRLHRSDLCVHAARHGRLDKMEYAMHDVGSSWTMEAGTVASEGGHLNVLVYANDHGLELCLGDCLVSACKNGHSTCVDHLLAIGGSLAGHEKVQKRAMKAASQGGHLDCMVSLRRMGCGWFSATQEAADNGHLRCLKYAHNSGCEMSGSEAFLAARGGHLGCLRYALYNDCVKDAATAVMAAASGDVACLEHCHMVGCPWDGEATQMAARHVDLDCLEYAHNHGCPWGEATTDVAAHYGSFFCLKYAHEHGCPWGEQTTKKAAEEGHLSCMRYAHQHGCPWSPGTLEAAAYSCCREYARQNGCPALELADASSAIENL